VTLTNCALAGNVANGFLGGYGGEGEGGGVYFATGYLGISNSTFSADQATGGPGLDSSQYHKGPSSPGGTGDGGGLYVAGGTATITNDTFSAEQATGGKGGDGYFFNPFAYWFASPGGPGQGGAMFVAGGQVEVIASTITSGMATGGHGGVGIGAKPGGVGYGGGISVASGMVEVSDSSIAANAAVGGADQNATFHADGSGGGFYNAGTLAVSNSTISGNTVSAPGIAAGGGMTAAAQTTLTAENDIVAGNVAPSSPDLNGSFASQGHNLIGDGTGGHGYDSTDLVGTSDHPIDPKLGPLQDNGGSTQTMALLPGSPAMGAGDTAGALPWDQRGPGFPRSVNGLIDIGAFEVQDFAQSFVVTNIGDAGPGSLRQALLDANAHSGESRITFAISGTGEQTIAPTSALPAITAQVFIDGASQLSSVGSPLVVLSGVRAGPTANGLTLVAGNSIVSGLVINSFAGAGILVQGAGGTSSRAPTSARTPRVRRPLETEPALSLTTSRTTRSARRGPKTVTSSLATTGMESLFREMTTSCSATASAPI
jgi:hypothetical protein